MQKDKKKEYTSPEMEVLMARVERGFTVSGAPTETEESPRYAMGSELGYKFS